MKKTVTLDSQATAHWLKAFKLSYDWQKNSPSIIAATLALSTLAELTPPGFYLARQKLKVNNLPPLNRELVLQGMMTKKSKAAVDYIVCHCSVICGCQTILTLQSVLIKPGAGPAGKKPKMDTYHFNHAHYWHTFTFDEVNSFASLSGDTNDVHRGVRPVVQGMLVLLALEDHLALCHRFFGSVDVQYLNPVLVGDPVGLYLQDEILYGIVDQKARFKLEFKEEKDVTKT